MLNKSIVTQITRVAKKWQTDLALPFESILPASVITVAAALEGVVFRDRVFSPGDHAVDLSGSGTRR